MLAGQCPQAGQLGLQRANSSAEQYVGILRCECLDHLLIHGERHLLQILGEHSRHYNMHRPHQLREQRPPLHEPGQTIDVTARIKRSQVVNGLINEYSSVVTSQENASSQPVCGFWHGAGSLLADDDFLVPVNSWSW